MTIGATRPAAGSRFLSAGYFRELERKIATLEQLLGRVAKAEARAGWYTRVRVTAASTASEAVRSTVTYTIELLDVEDAGPVASVGESHMVMRPGRATDTILPAAVGSEGEAWYFPDTAGVDTDQILRVHLFDERWAIEDCAS